MDTASPTRVLIVDDEQAIHIHYAEFLRKHYKLEVISATSGQEAQEILETHSGRFDVALVDEVLDDDGLTGMDVLKHIKHLYPEIAVILFSGWEFDEKYISEAMKAGAFRYVVKPFNHDDLAFTIQVAAEQTRLHREINLMRAVQESLHIVQAATSQQDIFERTCETAVNIFGAEHSGIVKFAEDGSDGIVVADYPPMDSFDQRVAVTSIADQRALVQQGKTLHYPLLKEAHGLGVVRDFIMGLGIKSLLIVPIQVNGRTIASMSLDRYSYARPFTPTEIAIAQTFANQIGNAIASAKAINRANEESSAIAKLQSATMEIMAAETPRGVLESAADIAREIYAATRVVVLQPDDEEQLIPVTIVPFAQEEIGRPRPNGLAQRVFKSGNAEYFEDINPGNQDFHPRLLQDGVRSAVCIPIQIGPGHVKRLGVMWLHFMQLRTFSHLERKALEVFGNQVAIAYQNALSLESQRLATQTMRDITQLSARARLAESMDVVLQKALELFSCDSITMYAYNAEVDRFVLAQAKGRDLGTDELVRRLVRPATDVRPDWALWKMIHNQNQSYYISQSVRDDAAFGKRFSGLADVKSAMAVKLMAGETPVGIFILNHHHRTHTFVQAEIERARLFAALTANLIQSTLLFRQKDLNEQMLSALNATVQGVTKSNSLIEALDVVAEQVVAVMLAQGNHTRSKDFVGHIGIVEDNRLHFHAIFPREARNLQRERNLIIDLKQPGGRIGIAGRVVLTGEPKQVITRLHDNPDYINEDERVHSQISVPMKNGDRVIGVISVESLFELDPGEDYVVGLERLAQQAVLALQKAELLERAKQARETMKIIAEVSSQGDLRRTLQEIANGVRSVLHCDIAAIYVWDADEKRFVDNQSAGYNDRAHMQSVDELVEGTNLWQLVHDEQPYHFTSHLDRNSILWGRFTELEGIVSVFGTRLVAAGQPVGFMLCGFREPRTFNDPSDFINDGLEFANHAAIAVSRAQALDRVQHSVQVLSSLYESSVAVTSHQDKIEDTLQIIVQEIMVVLGEQWVIRGAFAHIALLNGNRLGNFTASQPNVVPPGFSINLKEDRRIGISGTAAVTAEVQNVGDVNGFVGHIPFRKEITSQLSVPLIFDDQVIGVLSVEHPEGNAFNANDQQIVELFAAQAAVAIRMAKRFQEIDQLVVNRTHLAWAGMMGSTWQHATVRDAVTIRDHVELLRGETKPTPKVSKRLAAIERLVQKIVEKPITPPLTREEGVSSVLVNKFVDTRVQRLWTGEPYSRIRNTLHLDTSPSAAIRGSEEWLRRAFDILVDNAVEACRHRQDALIVISTRVVERMVEIDVMDNGNGIPPDVRPYLLKKPISKAKDELGQGIGLLLAQVIVQTYGGKLEIAKSDDCGTTMRISLPLENE